MRIDNSNSPVCVTEEKQFRIINRFLIHSIIRIVIIDRKYQINVKLINLILSTLILRLDMSDNVLS